MRFPATPSATGTRPADAAGVPRSGPGRPASRPVPGGPAASGLLTRRDLARLLLVSPRTLDRRRGAGEVLDPIPGPGQPRWLADEVWAWVEAGRPPADAWRRLRPRRR
jgi:hypothetical protein